MITKFFGRIYVIKFFFAVLIKLLKYYFFNPVQPPVLFQPPSPPQLLLIIIAMYNTPYSGLESSCLVPSLLALSLIFFSIRLLQLNR